MAKSSFRDIWTRDFTFAFASALLIWTGSMAFTPIVPIYLTNRWNASPVQVGLVTAIVTGSDCIIRLVSGVGMERWGRRSILLISLALWAVLAFVYGLPTSLAMLAVLRVLHDMPFAAGSTALHTVATDLIPETRRGEGMSYYSLATTLAIAIGPVLAMNVLGEGHFDRAFMVAGLLGLCALLPAWWIRCPDVRDRSATFSLSALVERRTAWLAFATALIYASLAAQSSFIALYSAQLKLAPTSWFFAVYGAGMVFSRAATGRLFDQHGPSPSIVISLTLLSVGLIALGLCKTPFSYLSAALLEGLGFGVFAPAAYAMVVNLVPATRRGAGNAMVVSAMSLGGGIGAYLCGNLVEVAGYRTMYVVAGLSLVVPAALFFLQVIPDYNRKLGH